MDIEGLGEKLATKLFSEKIIEDAADIYYLKREDLIDLEKMGEKSVSNILASIEKSKQRPLSRVIFAIGITHIGSETADLLVEHYSSIDALAAANEEQLVDIPSIGPKIAESIVAFFRQNRNKQVIEKLRKAGVRLIVEITDKKDLPLAGMEFVVTGKLDSFSRLEAEAKIKELGGKAGSTVTKKTNYVVVGEDPGSKLAKAQSLGIKIINEEEFQKLLEESGKK